MSEQNGDRQEERLQAMLAAAYALEDTPLTSESLRQRVVELAVEHESRMRRDAGRLRPLPGWGTVVCRLVAAVSLAAIAIVLVLRDYHSRGAHTSWRRDQAVPAATAPGADVARSTNRSDERIATIRRPSFWAAREGTRRGSSLPTPISGEQSQGIHSPSHDPRSHFPVGDDLAYVNGRPEPLIRLWAPLSEEERDRIEAHVRQIVKVRDDFVTIPFPRLVSTSDRQIAAAVESYKRQAAIVDPRLSRAVALQFKATALADLCEHLRTSTGVHLSAGASVADEKVTIFCEKLPLREVMRQLSRPFGYTWLRSKREGEYRYELVQDLHSQLLEEELRNRDRNAALIALDREMGQYRPYLGLAWGEVQARAKSATPEQKKVLDRLSSGWGMIQMYFRLSPAELKALSSGEKLTFSTEPAPGQRLMPPEQARAMIDSFRQIGALGPPAQSGASGTIPEHPSFGPPRDVAEVTVWTHQSELGQFTFGGNFGAYHWPPAPYPKPGQGKVLQGADRLAVGESPAVRSPDNAAANARLAGDPALSPPVTIHPQSSCHAETGMTSPTAGPSSQAEPKVTSADVLEALYHATGLPIVADCYTRLYDSGPLTVQKRPLFDLLNQVADTMHMRWAKDRGWLEFRSASFYDDRLKEVPNRLLARWADARRRQGMLSLDDLVEIARLSDAQLDATGMAEGARECWGLAEWDLARNAHLRPHWRYLAGFAPAQRQEATSANGLPFTQMSLAQQQQFLALTFGTQANAQNVKWEELAQAAYQVRYTPQGWFQWTPKGTRPDPTDIPPVRERTLEAALQAARRIDPQVTAEQITRTEPGAVITSIVGTPHHRYEALLVWVGPHMEMYGGP